MTDEVAEQQANGRTWFPVAAIAVTVVLWASAFVAIRHVAHEVSAGALSLGRLLVASLVLGGFVAAGLAPWWPGCCSGIRCC